MDSKRKNLLGKTCGFYRTHLIFLKQKGSLSELPFSGGFLCRFSDVTFSDFESQPGRGQSIKPNGATIFHHDSLVLNKTVRDKSAQNLLHRNSTNPFSDFRLGCFPDSPLVHPANGIQDLDADEAVEGRAPAQHSKGNDDRNKNHRKTEQKKKMPMSLHSHSFVIEQGRTKLNTK